MPRTIRPVYIEGNIAYVTLTKGYVAIIDATDVPLVSGYNWHAQVKSKSVYAVRTDRKGKKRKYAAMHRCIAGNCEGFDVDHVDGNGLNNCRNNLRLATAAQNQHNRKKQKNNTSGFKGVTWNKSNKKWQSAIRVCGEVKYLGCYPSAEEAYAAYCNASKEMHKEFGRFL